MGFTVWPELGAELEGLGHPRPFLQGAGGGGSDGEGERGEEEA